MFKPQHRVRLQLLKINWAQKYRKEFELQRGEVPIISGIPKSVFFPSLDADRSRDAVRSSQVTENIPKIRRKDSPVPKRKNGLAKSQSVFSYPLFWRGKGEAFFKSH